MRVVRKLCVAVPVIAGLLIFGLGISGQATAQGAADDPGQVTAGKAVYEMNCAGCHGDDGTGVAGRGRPLTGIASQGDRATHVASVADGKGGMPAFGSKLDAEEIDQSLSYVRLTFVAADSGDDDSSSDAASSDEATPELAMTGASTAELAVAGLALVSAGFGMVRVSRRRSN